MLYQITRKTEGSKVLASSGGYKAVVGCLVELFSPSHYTDVENGSESLACDTIISLLLMRKQIHLKLDESAFVPLLSAFAFWAEKAGDTPLILMASSICCLVFEFTSEESLLGYPGFDYTTLNALSRLIVRSLNTTIRLDTHDATDASPHLHEIITRGFALWADRFPRIRKAVDAEGKDLLANVDKAAGLLAHPSPPTKHHFSSCLITRLDCRLNNREVSVEPQGHPVQTAAYIDLWDLWIVSNQSSSTPY
ncbi:hypothetical protein Dimus_021314 [Dionaea muscipula]